MEDLFSKFPKAKVKTGEDLFLTGKIFLFAYKKLKNKNCPETREDLLTLMVKEKRLVQIHELEVLMNTSDSNYYSPLTKKSAFSYAVRYMNINFALLLLKRMKGEYENKQAEYFRKDLENLSELFDSESSKTAYQDSISDEDDLIVRMAKALTIEESFTQKGCRLKNGKITTGNTYPFSNYDDEMNRVKKKYDNQIVELENKKKKEMEDMKKGKETNKTSDIIEKELEKVIRIYKNFERNLTKTYENERHHIQLSITLNNVSRILFDKWSKKFNRDKMPEVQAMLVLEETLPNSEISCKIYVATNPDIQSFDGKNELEKISFVLNGRVKIYYEEDSLRNRLERILNSDKLTKISFVRNIFSKEEPNRHAEEILCDNINQSQKLPIYIYGTKRPCLSCYSRMEKEREKRGIEIHFSKDHGRFWKHTVNHVEKTIKGHTIRKYDVAINTLKLLAKSTVRE